MTYEYKRFKKDRASIIPIEETYTDNDINTNDPLSPENGYRFDAPHRWSTSVYKNKSIGIRDLHLIPSSGDIRCKFLCYGFTDIRGRQYDWKATNPNNPDDNAWIPHYVRTEEVAVVPIDYYRSISSDYNIQITPQNNFEEIITSMINFINESSWKSIAYNRGTNEYELYTPKEHDTNNKLFYVTETVDGNNDAQYSPLTYHYNINYLKQPITYYYEYDANVCKFNIKAYDDLRRIVMTDRSKYSGSDVRVARIEEYKWGDNNQYLYKRSRGFNLANHIELTPAVPASGDTPAVPATYYDSVYLGAGILHVDGYEVLTIINKNDLNSIKAIYDLFNQPMPDISTLPVVNLEDGLYVIPFVDKNNYESHFAYGSGTDKDHYNATYTRPEIDPSFEIRFIATNLKLNNVWDRLHLVYHSSFAETRHRIIGRNGDHWDTPNKQFIVPSTDQNQFYIRFTTDGIHHILPIGCHFNIDLAFMLNATNNIATGGNHDHFKD